MSQSQNLATTNATSAPEPMEALMAVTNPTSAANEPTATPDVLASVARPRLRSVRGEHTVPATARYAAELTDGALALRLQAITRLGVGSAPRRSSSITALTTHQPQARKLTVVPAADKQAAGQPDGAQPPHATKPAHTSTTPEEQTNEVARVLEGRTNEDAPRVPQAQSNEVAPRVADARTNEVAQQVPEAQTNEDARRVPEAETSAGVPRVTGAQAGEHAPRVPGARVWGGRLAQAVSEVLAGDRPISQLVRFTDDEVFMELNRRVRLLGLTTTATTRGAKEKSSVQSVRVFMPEPLVAEVAAHVRRGDRSRAIALRMEIRRNRWVCTALEIG
ncbi:Rv3235 family protein [Kribbella sp. NPDC058693]|uniref:Rv3235 family protein n=1 Tax=Kribbella sp. NPDC058693 TaxID=3346602 RepID=UPI0036525385